MTAEALSATGTILIDSLLRASLEGGLAALAVLAVCRLLPALSPRLRCWLWWFVGVKLLLSLAGVGLVGVPLLPSSTQAAPAASLTLLDHTPASGLPVIQLPPADIPSTSTLALSTAPVSSSQATLRGLPSWRTVVAGLWVAGVLFGLALLGREIRTARRLSRSATSVPAELAARAFADLPRRFGLAAPALKVSAEVSGPQVVGLARPQVLLPPGELADLGRPELTMLLAHELAHVKRGDLWLGWVPALAHRVFFFHPLAALAVREYALAREAACDAEVLRLLGTAPREYGRMLLRWGVVLRETGLAAAGASSSARNLKRRLEMLHDSSRPRAPRLRRTSVAAGFALAALLPIQIVAKSPATPATPVVSSTPATTAVAATPAVASTPRVATVAATPTVATTPVIPKVAAVAVTPAVASTAPVVAAAAGSSKSSSTSYSYSDDPDRELDGWAYIEGDESNMTMNGSGSSWKLIRRLRAEKGSPLLWVRRDGEDYVVRDPALLAEAKKLLEPVNELGRRQGELGAQQGELGAQQGELGGRQGELGAQQGELGGQQGALGTQQALLAAQQALLAAQEAQGGANQKDLDRKHAELEAQMEKLGDQIEALGRQQGELGERQAELGEQQAALGEKQAALGEKQAELGEQQAEASRKAEKAIADLLERALATGKAEEIE